MNNNNERIQKLISAIEKRLGNIINYNVSVPKELKNTPYWNNRFVDNSDYQHHLIKLIRSLKSQTIEHLFPLILFLEKILEFNSTLCSQVYFDRLTINELKANLEGISLDHTEINGVKHFAPIYNPYALEIKEELIEEIEKIKLRIPKGQAPTKANKKYQQLAYIHKILVDTFNCKSMRKACNFLDIPQSSYTSWSAGIDKYGMKNKDKFQEWFDNLPDDIKEEYTPKLNRYLKIVNYKIR